MTTPPQPAPDEPAAHRPVPQPATSGAAPAPPTAGPATAPAPAGPPVRPAPGPPGAPGTPTGGPPPLPRPVPLPPSEWQLRWPGPTGPARPVALGAVGVAALVAAVAVPLDRPGLGWPVAGLAAIAALVTAVVRPGATGAPGRAAAPVTGRVARVAWAAAALALLTVGAVRDAGWLVVLCLLAAAPVAALAVAGGRTGRGMLTAVRMAAVAPARSLPWARRSMSAANAGGTLGRSLVSVAVSIALLVVFGLLFSSADAVFAGLVTDLVPAGSPPDLLGWGVRLLVAGPLLLGGAYLLAAPPRLVDLRFAPGRPVRRREWVLPLALLDGLFAVFVLVQLTVLFGGSGHVLRTGGLTYAEYARGGFWQLLVVSGLTLLVIGGAARWAPRATRADRLLIRVLLGALTALSLVVVASALYRMRVYTDAYGATRLRLFVATVECCLGLLFGYVGVAVLRLRATWLPVLAVGTAVAALLTLAVLNPDRLIAEQNVDRYLRSGRLDVGYLAGLSADAAPALARLPEPQRSCALDDIRDRLVTEDDWRSANLGRARARQLLDAHPIVPAALTCPWPQRW